MTASTSDVANLIDTDVDGLTIQPWLDLSERDVSRAYSSSVFDGESHRDDFVAALTALRIISGLDRRPDRVSVAGSTISFDSSEQNFLKGVVRQLDPGSSFSPGGVSRDSSRNYGSANNPRDDSRIDRADRSPDVDLDDMIDESPYD
jgi:hypothetical protein